jgi:orotate phosphoribosyltransferase
METLQQILAKKLLQLKAFSVQIHNPFTWGNGWKAPTYFDDRKILSYPAARNFVKLELARIVAEKYPDADVIAGVAVNAIAHSTLVAEQLGLPLVYVYPTPKDHGLENQIEGDLRPHQNVVIIENQVNVGTYVMKVVDAIRNNGCKVLGVVSLFNYQFADANRKFVDADVELTALTDYETVNKTALQMGIVTEEHMKIVEEWHKNPAIWSPK